MHRLVANRSDGKVVEVGGGAVQAQPSGDAKDDKMAQVWLEYEYLLKSQLETQRAYFEELIEVRRVGAIAAF